MYSSIPGKHYIYAVCRQHFKGAGKSRYAKRMGIHAHKPPTLPHVHFPVIANALCNCKDLLFIKRLCKCRPAMTGRAKRHSLRHYIGSGTSL